MLTSIDYIDIKKSTASRVFIVDMKHSFTRLKMTTIVSFIRLLSTIFLPIYAYNSLFYFSQICKFIDHYYLDKVIASAVGQDFIFGYINNAYGSDILLAIVSNGNSQSANITITSIHREFETINILVLPNTVEKVVHIKFGKQ